jgi:glyoxylase-like metal-dependent hydrolase (beta-lactamase superfamily II)
MTELAAQIAAAAESPPECGGFREFGGAIVWIRLPVPGPLQHINVWLLGTGAGWTLVDTGLSIPAVEDAWRAVGQRLPALGALERILVTHHHPDHYGMAARLATERDVEVLISDEAYAATLADAGGPAELERRLEAFADSLGLALEPEFGEFLSGRRYRSIISGVPPRRGRLAAGQVLQTAAGSFRVSIHHGHAPGHACLHAADSGLLISGDQVLPTISPNISLYPGIADPDPLGSYLDSLVHLAKLPEETLVLPAHGRPFIGLGARLRALQEEHDHRLGRILATCRQGASTRDVVQALFRMSRLDALNRLLATTETLAHLRYLERRGRLASEGRGPSLRWVAA